jgi:hypothetical protein
VVVYYNKDTENDIDYYIVDVEDNNIVVAVVAVVVVGHIVVHMDYVENKLFDQIHIFYLMVLFLYHY